MRDIRPVPRQGKPAFDSHTPPQVRGAPPKPPRFTGEKVPVSTIHVDPPLNSASTSKPKRALFYKRDVTTKLAKLRVGQRERYVLLGIFGLVILAAVLAAAIFLPSASIQLIVRTAPLLVEQPLIIRAHTTANSDKIVPGSVFFRELHIEGESPVGSTEVIGTKAAGVVTIVNRTLDEQKILGQSRLVTKDDQLFYLTRPVTVAGNSQASVEVEAAEAGVEGNIEPQRLDFAALPAASQRVVYAEVPQKLSGGTGEVVPVVKDEDLAQAKDAAAAQARDKVTEDIRQELPEGWVILEESWTVETPELDTQAAVGDRRPAIPYTGRAIVRVLGYERATLDTYLEAALNEKLSQDFMLFPGPIAYTLSIDQVNWETAEAMIHTRVTHTTLPKISLDALRDKLAGRSKEDARSYLEGLSGIRSAKVELWPFWVNSVPRIHKRINIDLTPEQQPL